MSTHSEQPPQRFSGRFLYRQGARVSWAVQPERVYTIVQQRYTRRELLPPVYEYLLASHDIAHSFWASEADLRAIPPNAREERCELS